MFFKYVDRAAPKAEIREALQEIAAANGEELSKAKAHNLATKFKKGLFDPDLARFIQYSDPVGETAASNVDKEREAA